LTWRSRKAFVYNLEDFKVIQEFDYSGEGWGLTEDDTNLYMSDGTHVIRVVDPATFKTIRTIVVKDERGQPVSQLNELEWVKGEIWANIWQKGWIVRIDPQSGALLGRIDLNHVTDEETRQNAKADVLNGIAYDADGDRIFVTGKLWRRLFEITLKPSS
jgi:glutamine cyclotransferase